MSNFHGNGKKNSYFEGWYFKQSGEDGTVAFIPAFHVNQEGKKWASLQLITDEDVFQTEAPIEEFRAAQSRFLVELGRCRFSRAGCRVELKTPELSVTGILNYENMRKPLYDIMGPFALVPFMECRHKVISLHHTVSGQMEINGHKYRFQDGLGYIEGDRGRSFPRSYCWTQCYWEEGGIMLSIADIPFAGTRFQGCVGFVYINGKEHRLATYLGIKILEVSKDRIHVVQGSLELEVRLLEESPRPLRAPQHGEMDRTIHESLACMVSYKVTHKGKLILEHISQSAGFEWDME